MTEDDMCAHKEQHRGRRILNLLSEVVLDRT